MIFFSVSFIFYDFFSLRPLQKMGAGMALTALSFVIAGFLQLHMEVDFDTNL